MSDFEKSVPTNDAQANGAIVEIAGELTEWAYAGGIRAMALVTIDTDGEARTRICWKDGAKITLLGGVSILQATMAGEMTERAPKSNPLDGSNET